MTKRHLPPLFVMAVFAGLLAGCAHYVDSEITVFHQLPQDFAGATYAFVPPDPEVDDPVYRGYEKLVRRQLDGLGFREAPTNQASLAVRLNYGISGAKGVNTAEPIYRPSGFSGLPSTYADLQPQPSGSLGPYNSMLTHTPGYGLGDVAVHSEIVYSRNLEIDMVDRATLGSAAPRHVYHARVVSVGSSGSLAAVLPTMIRELFENFPGPNGETRTVREQAR